MNLTPNEKVLFAILIVGAVVVGGILAILTLDWGVFPRG